MISLEVRLDLPESVAREAEDYGLLSSEAIEALLRAELRRRRVDQLFAAADQLATLEEPPTAEEIEAEIQAARDEKRSSRESRS
jgi:hypothetical protein